MKTLANCSDVEFLRQTNKIRKYVEAWLNDTGILAIRERKHLDVTGLDDEAKKEAYRAETRARLNDMLDAALDTHAEQTARLLRLLCFIDPDDTEAMKMPQLLGAVGDIMNNQEVLDFFTSLGRLGLMNTQTQSEQSD